MSVCKTLLAVSIAALFGAAVAPAQAANIQGGFYRAPYGFGGFDFRPASGGPATCIVADRLERDSLGTQYWTRVRTCD